MRQVVLGLAAVLAGCVATTRCPTTTPRFSSEVKEELLQTECGAAYHWVGFPIPVRVDSALPAEYVARSEEAVSLWNSLVGRRFLLWEENLFTSVIPTTAERGVVFIIQEELGINQVTHTRTLGWADTRVESSSGEVIGSIVKIDFDVPSDLLLTVILHEIGHAMGLAHDETDPRSVMFPYIWEPRVQRVLTEDIEVLQSQLPETLPEADPVFVPPSVLSPFWSAAPPPPSPGCFP